MEIVTSVSFLCPILLITLRPEGRGCSDSRNTGHLLSLFSMAKGGFSNCHSAESGHMSAAGPALANAGSEMLGLVGEAGW